MRVEGWDNQQKAIMTVMMLLLAKRLAHTVDKLRLYQTIQQHVVLQDQKYRKQGRLFNYKN